jgi:hypothetical protein
MWNARKTGHAQLRATVRELFNEETQLSIGRRHPLASNIKIWHVLHKSL